MGSGCRTRYRRKERGGVQLPFSSLFSGLCIGHDSSMDLDEDLDALWAADKRAAFLQKVNSLNAPHKVNTVRLISCPHSPLSPLGTRLEIKATALGPGAWRCRTGLRGGGALPPWLNSGQVGEICQARTAQSPQLSRLTNPKSNTHHPPRGRGRVSITLQIQQMFSGDFNEKLEDLTNQKPREEILIPHHFPPRFS